MIKYIKNLDAFTKNIIIVFLGISLANFLNLVYQLLIAHKLSPTEFAAFNSLLSIFIVVSSPLGTIQMAIAKYSAEFNANNQINKLKFLLSDLLKRVSVLGGLTLLAFWFTSGYIINTLKITSVSSGYILAGLLASSWITPLLAGGIQGLELFGWLTFGSVATIALKLILAFVFLLLGYSIAGALGAFLVASLVGLFVYYFPLRRIICLKPAGEDINYKEMLIYLLPLAISNFCFISLVSFDMVLVKYFFTPQDSGLYSLAQMVGKIFLFLPGSISIVMFPRVSGLNAKNLDTISTLKRSLLYVFGLCVIAAVFYNLFPSFVLKILTGKVYPESITLGRLFSVSMSFFTLLYIFIAYFLSIKDFRFIKFLVLSTILQFVAIVLFHKSLTSVQVILCINAILLFFTHYSLVGSRR